MKMRVSSVQYPLQPLESFEDFQSKVEHYVSIGSHYHSEYILFPEYFTTELLTLEENPSDVHQLTVYTGKIEQEFQRLAEHYQINIIAGTHMIKEEEDYYNVSKLYRPDKEVEKQAKLHLTPEEVEEWNVQPGNDLNIIDTPKGKIAILTCYDIEFPEIVRIAREKGVNVVFCPSNTDNIHGYQRIRFSAHARAIENQIYVVTSGLIGSLPSVEYMRMVYGKSLIVTPNDIPFPQGGVLSEGESNKEAVITTELDIGLLEELRSEGSVTTWKDRRPDLYESLR